MNRNGEFAPAFNDLQGRPAVAVEKIVQQGSASGSSILTSAGNVWKSARPVPEADDLNPFLVAPQPVDDAIRPANYFTQIRLSELRHHATDFRVRRHALGTRDQFISQPRRRIGIVAGNVKDNVRQIGLRRWRDDYLPAHLAILALTSSIGTPSPRSSSSSPCWTA